MTRSRHRGWLRFAACVMAVVAALGWVTAIALQLEDSQVTAQERLRHAEAIGGALWRMDTYLARHLATEAARAPGDYRAVIQSQDSAGAGLPPPSPLLGFRSPFIRLHVEVILGDPTDVPAPEIVVCSPQAPPLTDKIESVPLPREEVLANRRLLTHAQAVLESTDALERVIAAERRVLRDHDTPSPTLAQAQHSTPPARSPPVQQFGQVRQSAEARARESQEVGYSKRAQFAASNLNNQNWLSETQQDQQEPLPSSDEPLLTGPLVPIWVPSRAATDSSDELFYLRRVRSGSAQRLQGFLVDWPTLERLLLAEIADLFPVASLHPTLDEVDPRGPRGSALASLPATLEAPVVPLATAQLVTPTRLALLATWLAALVALGTATLTLRASQAFAEKQRRFTSAVTHELRTPLTTFRMYSEMLAEGMIAEPERRQLYLNTIKDESSRLARLVENVLSHARLEEGRRPTRRVQLEVQELLDRCTPLLARHAEEHGAKLVVGAPVYDRPEPNGVRPLAPTDAEDAVRAPCVHVDPDAVEQILYNLVDNACKYGCRQPGSVVTIEPRLVPNHLELHVTDPGAGIAASTVRGLFTPFDRCGHESSTTPGVGLGLALSREFARTQGGELRLAPGPQTCFVLTLPLAPFTLSPPGRGAG